MKVISTFRRIAAVLGIAILMAPGGMKAAGRSLPFPQNTTIPAALQGAIAVSTGGSHTCAISHEGTAMCWGYNNYGQLGNGTNTTQYTPIYVSGLPSVVTAISAGENHTCAILPTGELMCWGYNLYGQLGDGTSDNRTTPVSVIGLDGPYIAVSAGLWHTCALSSGGGVKCWGSNWAGQLGDGTNDDRLLPVDVYGLGSDVVAISAGWSHTCALLSWGEVRCWGHNSYGQLGDGTTTSSSVPVAITGLYGSAWSISAGGYHTCALTTSGTQCWGDNYWGQLGDYTYEGKSTPVMVAELSGVLSIEAGGFHTCAFVDGGGVKCWGSNNSGQLGNNQVEKISLPVYVYNLEGVIGVVTGSNHNCSLTVSEGIKCWGWNKYGQLGNNSMADSYAPVDVYWPWFTPSDYIYLPFLINAGY